MHRLVVQHPGLSDPAVAAFSAAVRRAPDARTPTLAVWEPAATAPAEIAAIATAHAVDAALVPVARRLDDYRLIAFDMDSTLITIETIDEIADFCGRKAEVAAITEAAMRGEITDYDTSLRRRVALLEGLPESALEQVYVERMALTPGARTLIAACKAHGLRVLLVSGGFTWYTERLRARLGLDFTRANTLEISGGRLTGRLVDGPIVNAELKRETVETTCRAIGCSPSQAIVVGDGANDLRMMAIAGVSIAFHAKPVVRAQTTHAIDHGGLDAILPLFAG